MVLSEDGRHAWLGRATDPSEPEILAVEKQMDAQGFAGWIAVSEGVYYSNDEMSLIEVRPLGTPTADFQDAVTRFNALRAAGSCSA